MRVGLIWWARTWQNQWASRKVNGGPNQAQIKSDLSFSVSLWFPLGFFFFVKQLSSPLIWYIASNNLYLHRNLIIFITFFNLVTYLISTNDHIYKLKRWLNLLHNTLGQVITNSVTVYWFYIKWWVALKTLVRLLIISQKRLWVRLIIS